MSRTLKAMTNPSTSDSESKLVEFKELKDTARGEELEALTEHILKALGYEPFRSGRGADGGKDLLCVQKIKSELVQYNRIWLVQCKHFAHGRRAVNEADIGAIVDKCRKHGADGFFVVSTTVLTNELVKVLEAISAERRDGIVTGYWDEHRLREILLRPAVEDVLRRFLPESFRRVQALQPVEILLEKLGAQGVDGLALAEIGRLIARSLDAGRVKKNPSLKYYPAASLDRDSLEVAVAAFSSGDLEGSAEALAKVPYEEWSALVSGFEAENRASAEDLLEYLATEGAEEDQRFAAVRRLVSDYEYGLDEILPLIEQLQPDSVAVLVDDLGLERLVRERVEAGVANENPHSLDDLPAHQGIVGVDVDTVEFSHDPGNTLTARVEFTVEVSVSADGGEDYESYCFPGQGTVYVYGINQMDLEDVSVDVTEFFGTPDGDLEPPDH